MQFALDVESFNHGEAHAKLGDTRNRVRMAIIELKREGWLRDIEDTGSNKTKRIGLTDAGRDGMARALGELQVREASPDASMWRTVRRLKDFSPRDIQAWSSMPDAEVTIEDARKFCALLLRAGYLRVVRRAKPGVREAIYRLVRDTGPKPPKERRVRAVYDANEDRLVQVEGLSL